jgi:hypothetical protein
MKIQKRDNLNFGQKYVIPLSKEPMGIFYDMQFVERMRNLDLFLRDGRFLAKSHQEFGKYYAVSQGDRESFLNLEHDLFRASTEEKSKRLEAFFEDATQINEAKRIEINTPLLDVNKNYKVNTQAKGGNRVLGDLLMYLSTMGIKEPNIDFIKGTKNYGFVPLKDLEGLTNWMNKLKESDITWRKYEQKIHNKLFPMSEEFTQADVDDLTVNVKKVLSLNDN